MRNYILLTLAVLAGFVAFFLSKTQLQQRYRELDLNARKIKVVVPKHDMVEGDTIRATDLTLRYIFAADQTGDEVLLDDVRQIIGQELAVSVKQRVPFRWQDLALPDLGSTGSTLARRIPPGERALSVAVSGVSSVSGMIRPNDRVDIIGMFQFPEEGGGRLGQAAMTLLQNVTVLAVGQELASADGITTRSGRVSYSTLTLSLTQEEAELLVFAQSQGELTMTLRPPADVAVDTDLQQVDFNELKRQARQFNQDRQERLSP